MGPRILPAIKLEAKVRGKKVSKDFNSTMNTSVFANQITDLLEKSDGRKIAIEVKRPKKTLGEKIREKVVGKEGEEEKTSKEKTPLEVPIEETPETSTPTLPEKKLKETEEEIDKLRLG